MNTERIIDKILNERNLEWDDIHDVRECCELLAKMITKSWLKTSENLDKLQDHYYYLVTHPNYKTPIKAKYHDDLGGYFEFPHYPSGCEYIDPVFGECRIKYFMEIPEMPDDYEEVDDID